MDKQIRQTALKTKISNLLNGSYVVKEGWEPNYVLHKGRKISRANIIGVVVSKNQSELSDNMSVMIDDGSGKISVRSFEGNSLLNNVAVGQVVLLIGRPREYGNEIYIVPEIIREIKDNKWVEVRKLELDLIEEKGKGTEETEKIEIEKVSGVQEEEAAGEDAGDSDPDDILKIIKDLDKGEGADFGEVASLAKKDNSEEIITNLMKNGDIFELKPGKLKVLE